MKIVSMLYLHSEYKDLKFNDAFKATRSSSRFELIGTEYDSNSKLHSFNFETKEFIDGLETITLSSTYTFGIRVTATISDNLFSTRMHSHLLDSLYKDIRYAVLRNTATKIIDELGLRECLVYGITTPHHFSIIKPHKLLRPYIYKSTNLLINKNGAVITYEPPFYTDSWKLVKKLEKEIIYQLCTPLLEENSDE